MLSKPNEDLRAASARVNGLMGTAVIKAKKIARIAAYNAAPVICVRCGNSLTYDQRGLTYCSRSCSVSVRNEKQAQVSPGYSKTFLSRFWAKVEIREPNECWPWTGATVKGYGQLYAGRGLPPKKAHVAAYEIANGSILDNLHVCHTCDNPPCCNPSHLWLGTNLDNHKDKDEKGRHGYTGVLGELHPRASMTNEIAAQIKELLLKRPKDRTLMREVCQRFQISSSTFYGLKTGASWKHIK